MWCFAPGLAVHLIVNRFVINSVDWMFDLFILGYQRFHWLLNPCLTVDPPHLLHLCSFGFLDFLVAADNVTFGWHAVHQARYFLIFLVTGLS